MGKATVFILIFVAVLCINFVYAAVPVYVSSDYHHTGYDDAWSCSDWSSCDNHVRSRICHNHWEGCEKIESMYCESGHSSCDRDKYCDRIRVVNQDMNLYNRYAPEPAKETGETKIIVVNTKTDSNSASSNISSGNLSLWILILVVILVILSIIILLVVMRR